MENTTSLKLLDKQLRYYHMCHNYGKQPLKSVCHTGKAELTKFYREMQLHNYQRKLKIISLDSSKEQQAPKLRNSLSNPLATGLPNSIKQEKHNIDNPTVAEVSDKPLFSQVTSSIRQHNYHLSPQVKQQICQDIGLMEKQKNNNFFGKKYPKRSSSGSKEQGSRSSEAMVKQFNRMVVKFKNRNGIEECDPVDVQNAFDEAMEVASQPKFRMFSLFKKLYQEQKTSVNQQFISYVLGFHTQQNQGVEARHRAVTGKPIKHKGGQAGVKRFRSRKRENQAFLDRVNEI